MYFVSHSSQLGPFCSAVHIRHFMVPLKKRPRTAKLHKFDSFSAEEKPKVVNHVVLFFISRR